VEKLNIKNNGLKSIPHEFQGSLPRLAELNISGNRLETFPSLYWDDIKILDVSRNEVKSISTEALKTATSLETVNIKCNAVSCLPEELGQLSHLKELCLDYNKLQSLPDCDDDAEEEKVEETDEIKKKKKKKSKGCWTKLKCLEILKVSYVYCSTRLRECITHIGSSLKITPTHNITIRTTNTGTTN
jgi:hypothetical protein